MRIQIKFPRPKMIIGKDLIFRCVEVDDSAYILKLRTDDKKSQHLSKTANDLHKQEEWIKRSSIDLCQIYFIIMDKNFNNIGTVRLYDPIGDSFCWGSWIIQSGSPNFFAIESALMVYLFGISLGFQGSHFDVRKQNISVWKFHERFGALRKGEDMHNYFYRISRDAILNSIEKYSKFLPTHGLKIEY